VSALWLQRFVPSEFGANIDVYAPNDKSVLDFVFALKRAIRKELRETGVPYTLICNGGFGGFVWAPLAQLDVVLSGNVEPPREKITISGDGEGLGKCSSSPVSCPFWILYAAGGS
jgi:hypothetical protein